MRLLLGEQGRVAAPKKFTRKQVLACRASL
jgi:hypothetical protein